MREWVEACGSVSRGLHVLACVCLCAEGVGGGGGIKMSERVDWSACVTL